MIDKKQTFDRIETLLHILQYEIDKSNVTYGADILKNGKTVGKMVITNEGILTSIHDELLDLDSFNPFMDRGLDQKVKYVELGNDNFSIKHYVHGIEITTINSDKRFIVYSPGHMVSYYSKDSNNQKQFYTEIDKDKEEISDLEDEVYEATGFDIMTSAINIFNSKDEAKKKKIVLTPNK